MKGRKFKSGRKRGSEVKRKVDFRMWQGRREENWKVGKIINFVVMKKEVSVKTAK